MEQVGDVVYRYPMDNTLEGDLKGNVVERSPWWLGATLVVQTQLQEPW